MRQSYTDSRPRLRAKTIVLPPGIDVDRFDPSHCAPATRQRLRQQWGISPDCSLVGIVGNLNPMKGHTYFIEAAHQIKQRVPNTKFVIVGRKVDSAPGYWEGLHNLAARLELSENLVFTDYQEDIPAVLSAFDVFVLSSVLESCPNVVLEAMAMKIPIVATDVGAVTELLDDGKVGTIVPSADTTAIAGAVLAWLTRSTGEIETITDAARKRVETFFGLDRITCLQLEVYEALTG
jgi:glycosyltransferase involved in cell wall biosynthesis